MNYLSSPLTSLSRIITVLLLIFHLHDLSQCSNQSPWFQDVSITAGMSQKIGPRLKYGGASIADLDGDGWPDLLLGHHGDHSIELYWNNRDGSFSKSHKVRFVKMDRHAITAFRADPRDEAMYFVISNGGSRGRRPSFPSTFRVFPNRTVSVLPHAFRMQRRGRSALVLSMRADRNQTSPRPDFLFFNKKDEFSNHTRAFLTSPNSTFLQHALFPPALANTPANYAGITDLDGDGVMEVILLWKLSIWRLTADFTYADLSDFVLPPAPRNPYFAALSYVELDYDNDGHWDCFFAQSNTGQLRWMRHTSMRDVLLRNANGQYYTDESKTSGIWLGGGSDIYPPSSHGVTAADFDNDGYVDLFISRFSNYPVPYVLLRNLGNGTFEQVTDLGIGRNISTAGDMATAVDFDRDGHVDLILSEGDTMNRSLAGTYRIIRNTGHWGRVNGRGAGHSFLLVRVRSSPNWTATSLHAVVRARFSDGTRMMRRVTSPGTTISNSYVELLHFGLGLRSVVDVVSTTWIDGSVQEMTNVTANSTIEFGV